MHLRKTTGYALRILTFLAKNKERLYTAQALYDEMKIPQRYLRKLLINLTGLEILNRPAGRETSVVISNA